MCNCSFRHENFDFMVRENVILVVQRYGEKKLQMSWKMMSMWYIDKRGDIQRSDICHQLLGY